MHSLNSTGSGSGQEGNQDAVDRALTAVFVVSMALAITSFTIPFLELVVGKLRFSGHGLLDRSSTVPLFWAILGFISFGFRQKRRQNAMRAKNHPDPLEVPAWSLAWAVVITVLYGLDAFTRLHGSSRLAASEMVFGVPGVIAILVGRQRKRRAHGIPMPEREMIAWALWAIIAVVGLLVLILLTKWMR